jgi:hypothetical protein
MANIEAGGPPTSHDAHPAYDQLNGLLVKEFVSNNETRFDRFIWYETHLQIDPLPYPSPSAKHRLPTGNSLAETQWANDSTFDLFPDCTIPIIGPCVS